MSKNVTRRFNYTRRMEIPRSNVEIDVRLEGAVPVATLMRLALEKPQNRPQEEWDASLIVLEAWRSDISAYQRFTVGAVAKVAGKSPAFVARLTEFPDGENLTFRIKVLDATTARILAEADGLKSVAEDQRRDELIQVFPADLGELPWTIDWSDENEGPKIQVNSRIERNGVLLTGDPVVLGLFLRRSPEWA